MDVAIGVAGLAPLEDYRGCVDRRGRKLTGTIVAPLHGSAFAAAAGILMRKPLGCPVVFFARDSKGKLPKAQHASLIRTREQDRLPMS